MIVKKKYKMNKLMFPNVKQKEWHRTLGFILSTITFGLVINLFYGRFFKRTEYYNRKYFLQYLKKNRDKFPKCKKILSHKIWILDEYKITLIPKTGTWYIFRGDFLFLNSFILDPFDRKTYNECLEILKNIANL